MDVRVLRSNVEASGMRDSSGLMLGELAYIDDGDIAITTPKGYIFVIDDDTGEIKSPGGAGSIHFLDSACSGTPYAINVHIRPLVFSQFWHASQSMEIMSIAADIEPILLQAGQSVYWWGSTSCIEYVIPPGSRYYLMPMVPNDPARTGIGNGPFLPPFTISMRSLFIEGFDGA